MSNALDGTIEVVVESYLEDLVPRYLERRRADMDAMAAALDGGDFETSQSLGHQMKGSGGGYGFDDLTDIGARLEAAARDQDAGALRAALADLGDFLDRVHVRYE